MKVIGCLTKMSEIYFGRYVKEYSDRKSQVYCSVHPTRSTSELPISIHCWSLIQFPAGGDMLIATLYGVCVAV